MRRSVEARISHFYKWERFNPFDKNKNHKSSVYKYYREYADTKEEAIRQYNHKIDEFIAELKKTNHRLRK